MQSLIDQLLPNHLDWQQLCKTLKATTTLTSLVLTAWQMGLWFAKAIVEQQLAERAQAPTEWSCCSVCGTQLVTLGFCETPNAHTCW